MSIKIVADSSCDLNDELKKSMNINLVPLTLELENETFIDDEKLDIKDYVKRMDECKTSPKTSCPSPNAFMNSYKTTSDSTFVVTLSSKLSGSYNSACLAKDLLNDEDPNHFVHVFDSLSASIGETLVSLKILELSKSGTSNVEIVAEVTKYIKEMKTLFLLQSLEHLAKAGRLNPIIAKVASMLSIKPIMSSDGDGNIKLMEKCRGYTKAFSKLIDLIGKCGDNFEDKVIGIAHCNCLDRALKLKEEISKRYNFKEIIIVEMSGLSSTYADDGGIVIAF